MYLVLFIVNKISIVYFYKINFLTLEILKNIHLGTSLVNYINVLFCIIIIIINNVVC